MKDYEKLADAELRVEVAKALGWTNIHAPTEAEQYPPGGDPELHPLWEDDDVIGVSPEFSGKSTHCWPVPGFPSDLNACHEFEAWLLETKGELAYEAYAKLLQSLDGSHTTALAKAAFATARQRCLALLATLEGQTK